MECQRSEMSKRAKEKRIVLHPSLRAEWFRSTETTIPEKKDAVEKAEALLTSVARSYHEEMLADMASKTASNQPSTSDPCAPSTADDSWLQSLCNVEVTAIPVQSNESSANELNDEVRCYLTFEGGKGELQHPLAWWKVCQTISGLSSLLMNTYNRNMLDLFRCCLVWPGTSLRYLRQVYLSNVHSQSHDTFVVTSGPLSRLKPSPKPCWRRSGFEMVFWILIRLQFCKKSMVPLTERFFSAT